METAILDGIDRGLVHALQLDGRAPFSKIADVLGISEQTAARRYRRLREAGVLRVVGGVNAARLGYEPWTIRVRCTPDAGGPIADALARRSDTYWVHLLSGGTEISCFTQAPDTVLLEKLPRTSRVLGMTAHSLLHVFATPSRWAGLSWLTEEQAVRLRPEPPTPDPPEPPTPLDERDYAMIGVLAGDGRAGYTSLAAATGWSESTVKRRLHQLRAAGVIDIQLDYSPAPLGYRVEARLWMSVRPSELAAVAGTLAGHPEVAFVAVTTGPTNLVAAAVCRDNADLYRYLTERVGGLDAINSLETAPVLRTVKRTGTLHPQSYRRPTRSTPLG